MDEIEGEALNVMMRLYRGVLVGSDVLHSVGSSCQSYGRPQRRAVWESKIGSIQSEACDCFEF